MAEKLPEGAGAGARAVKHNTLPPLSGMPRPGDVSVATENLGSPRGSGEPYLNGSNGLVVSNGPSSVRSKTHVEVGKNGTRLPDSDTKLEFEWVEQDEPGVQITLTALPGGARDLKRVRFSRKRFSNMQAEQWWQENCARVYELYNVRVVDKSVASIESEWVEQDEPGVQITLTALPGGARDLKRVRFSRKRFSETQAEQWWEENRARVYELYNVRVVDKSVASIDSDVSH